MVVNDSHRTSKQLSHTLGGGGWGVGGCVATVWEQHSISSVGQDPGSCVKLIHLSTSVLVSCWFWSSVAEPLLAHRADEKLLLSPFCRTGLGLQWGFPFSYLVTLGFSLVAMHGGPRSLGCSIFSALSQWTFDAGKENEGPSVCF